MRIGFIGLGKMGHHMVANLQQAGHDLTVHDTRRAACDDALARGATWADSPADVAHQTDITFTSLPGPKEVEQVATGERGIIHGARPGSFYVDLSTSSPTLIRTLHQAFRERGVQVADAPVSGGVAGAEDGSLQIMIGCDPQVLEQIKPALLCMGDKVTYIGAVGAGEVAKLCHNQLSLVVQQAVAEVFSLGARAGIQPDRLLDAIRGGAYGRSQGQVGSNLEAAILHGDWERPRFALALARKDIGLATDLGKEFAVPMPLAAIAEQTLIECVNRGWGNKDMSATWALQEDRARIVVRLAEQAATT
jgi:3-hydroxyisobutyrate dehydrogenase